MADIANPYFGKMARTIENKTDTQPSDPGETTNIYSEHPEIVAQMIQAYEKWWQDIEPHLYLAPFFII